MKRGAASDTKAPATLLDYAKDMIMTKRTKTACLPKFDAAPYLDSEAAIAAYLTDILEANDSALLASALGDIARARGVSEIAKASGLTRSTR